jgi:FkbM family methyltransferase
MIEPQRDKKAELDIVAGKLPDVDYASALVGAELRDSVSFHVNDTVSSVLPEKESTAAEQTTLPMTTLDRLTEGTRFEDPGFLKLDVQGYELEVLRGAESLLSRGNVEVLLMEVSLIEINEGAPLAADVLSFMDERGYQLYDICSFFRRPLDDALWQIDSIFVRKDSDLVASNRWQ